MKNLDIRVFVCLFAAAISLSGCRNVVVERLDRSGEVKVSQRVLPPEKDIPEVRRKAIMAAKGLEQTKLLEAFLIDSAMPASTKLSLILAIQDDPLMDKYLLPLMKAVDWNRCYFSGQSFLDLKRFWPELRKIPGFEDSFTKQMNSVAGCPISKEERTELSFEDKMALFAVEREMSGSDYSKMLEKATKLLSSNPDNEIFNECFLVVEKRSKGWKIVSKSFENMKGKIHDPERRKRMERIADADDIAIFHTPKGDVVNRS